MAKVEERRRAQRQISKLASRNNLNKLKLYTDEERESVKGEIQKSSMFENIEEDKKNEIFENLNNASDAQLSVLRNTAKNCIIRKHEGTAFESTGNPSCYSEGAIYLEESDRNNPRVLWHEFGHYMDDFKTSKMSYDKVTYGDGGGYEVRASSFSDVLKNVCNLAESEDCALDLQETLQKYLPDKYKVEYREGYACPTIMGANGEEIEWDIEATNKILGSFIEDVGEKEYKAEIGYPEAPKYDDYFVTTWRVDKRYKPEIDEWGEKHYKEKMVVKPKFKGAEEKYHEENRKYYDERDRIEKEHPEFGDKMTEFWNEKQRREELISPVSDCLCAVTLGTFGSIYGDHDKSYWQRGYHLYNEWVANIHQMKFMGQEDALGLLRELLPRTMKKVEGAYDEWMWRNIGA